MRGTLTYWQGMIVLYGIEGIDWNYLVSYTGDCGESSIGTRRERMKRDTFVGYRIGSEAWQASVIFGKRLELTIFRRALRGGTIEVRLQPKWLSVGLCICWFGLLVALHNRDYSYEAERLT